MITSPGLGETDLFSDNSESVPAISGTPNAPEGTFPADSDTPFNEKSIADLAQHFLDEGGHEGELAKLAETNPEVRGVLQKQEVNVAVKALTGPETILSSQTVKGPNGETTQIEVTDKDGKKTTLTEYGLIGAMILMDTIFNGGRQSAELMRSILGKVVTAGVNKYLIDLGFNPSSLTDTAQSLYKKMLDGMDSNSLTNTLTQLNGDELFNFLNDLDPVQRTQMLSGERFGGLLGNKHKLDEKTLSLLKTKLTKDQANQLKITA